MARTDAQMDRDLAAASSAKPITGPAPTYTAAEKAIYDQNVINAQASIDQTNKDAQAAIDQANKDKAAADALDAETQSAMDTLNKGINPGAGKTVTNTIKNTDGSVTTVYSDGSYTQSAAPVTGVGQSARDIVNTFLKDAGMAALTDQVWSQWTSGTTAPQIIDYVRSTPEYAARFPAMAALNKSGRNISEATYIAKEQADVDLMKQYGLDMNVFGTPQYLGSLIENNVNQVDLQGRLNALQNTVLSKDSNILKYAQDTYGLTTGDLMSWAMAPQETLASIQQKAQAMQIGGAAVQAGFAGTGPNGEITQQQAQDLAAQGVTQAQAQQGFVNLGQMTQFGQTLPGDTSGALTNQQMINAQFGTNAQDVAALGKVKQGRTAEFQQGGGYTSTAGGITGLGAANSQA